jgi:hypothetical protein
MPAATRAFPFFQPIIPIKPVKRQMTCLVRYHGPVKAKSETPFQRFTKAMDGLISVPHDAIKKALAEEKVANAGKPKRGPKPKHLRTSASDRASCSEN